MYVVPFKLEANTSGSGRKVGTVFSLPLDALTVNLCKDSCYPPFAEDTVKPQQAPEKSIVSTSLQDAIRGLGHPLVSSRLQSAF